LRRSLEAIFITSSNREKCVSKSLDGYVVFITGGSTGLGLSHARVLGGRGAKVAITDFRQDNLDQASAALKRDGVDALCLKADNRVVGEVKAAVAKAEARFGKVDVLVNNAGISGMMAHIEDIDEGFFDSLFDTHVKGAFFAVQAVVPGMKKRKFGRIINTGSTFNMTGASAMSHYTGAKGALTALARACAPFSITVNTVSPGFTDTPVTRSDVTPEIFDEIIAGMALKRQVLPEEVSYAVAWLASREADAVTGQNISPNCGQAIVGI
jgi:NAD(P)-dependent dehydrogenase (short-subunit alcohol dehydrogenase family)